MEQTNKFAAVIYDRWNVIVKVAERPTITRAVIAGEFYTKAPGSWYQIVKGEEEIELHKSLINA